MNDRLQKIVNEIGTLSGRQQVNLFLILGQALALTNQEKFSEAIANILITDLFVTSKDETKLHEFAIALGNIYETIERRYEVETYCSTMETEIIEVTNRIKNFG